MRYLETWLSGLGLEYIIPKLRVQGITTPKKLAALSLRDIYEVVGVDDVDDRKKLYFLIRRLKSILKNKDGSAENDEETVEHDGENMDDNTNEENVVEIMERSNSVPHLSNESHSLAIAKDQDDLRKLRVGSKLRPPTANRSVEPIIFNERSSTVNHSVKPLVDEPHPTTTVNLSVEPIIVDHPSSTVNHHSVRPIVNEPPLITTVNRSVKSIVVNDLSPIHSSGQSLRSPMISVVVRKRPLSAQEKQRGDRDIIFVNEHGSVDLKDIKVKVDLTKVLQTMRFQFDNAFGDSVSNRIVYQSWLRESVPSLFDDVTVSCFTFGPTGSGKTHTMYGQENDPGLYTQAVSDLLELMSSSMHLSVTCFEIYGEKLFDLLNERNPIKCLEDKKQKVCFPGLTEHPISSIEEFSVLLQSVAACRSTSSTRANHDSSRSHQVLQISMFKSEKGDRRTSSGKLVFVDLAGSENAAETMNSSKSTRMEGAEINTSLLALKEVFRSLGKHGHTPFRGSKLTQVLKESLQGKTKTCMIVCISPSSTTHEQTVNALRYAAKVYDLGGGEPCEGLVTEDGTVSSYTGDGFSENNRPVSSNSVPNITTTKPRAASASRGMIRPKLVSPPFAVKQPQPILSTNPAIEKEYSRSNSTGALVRDASRRNSLGGIQRLKPQSKESNILKARESSNNEDVSTIEDYSLQSAWSLLSVHKSSISEMVEVMKDEMELVQNMENVDERDTDNYISRLQQILALKTATISSLKLELCLFAESRNEK